MSEPSPPQRQRGTDPVADGDEVLAPRPREADPSTAPWLPAEVLGTYVVGFAMGAADTVPAFSGGTVALVAGIYERLVANVRQGARALSLIVRGRIRDGGRAIGAIEWAFVIALLSGVFSAIVALASVLERQLEANPVRMSALFLGLVIGATVVASGELRAPAWRHAGVGLVVALVTFVALGFRAAEAGDPSLLFVFVAGSIAICAMILPGVSGSFLLVLLGLYTFVVGAVNDRDLLVLGALAAGCLVGLATFSTFLNWLLRHHHDVVLAALIGLMAGSSRVLWPWPSEGGIENAELGAPVAGELGPAVLIVVVGAVAVGLFASAARRVAATR